MIFTAENLSLFCDRKQFSKVIKLELLQLTSMIHQKDFMKKNPCHEMRAQEEPPVESIKIKISALG